MSRLLLVLVALVSAIQAQAADAEPEEARLDGSVEAAVQVALDRSPRLAAAKARWSAQDHATSRAGRLPEPTASVGVFAQSVETRVGPQLARLSLQQAIPWPTALTSAHAQAIAWSRAAEAQLGAEELAVEREVRQAWWTLWEVRRLRVARAEHAILLDGLAALVRARVETGAATLADLQQVGLSRARLADEIASLESLERAHASRLRSVIGLDGGASSIQTAGSSPEPSRPLVSRDTLVRHVLAHPRVLGATASMTAAQRGVSVARSERAPVLTAGVDWIVTGASANPAVADSGKDAVMVRAGVQLPLWQRGYGHDVAAARSTSEARAAEVRTTELEQLAALDEALFRVIDSGRRQRLVAATLLPQAEIAYRSVLGTFTSGGGSVSQVQLAQRDLLELRIAVDTHAAAHARSWADLEALCGTHLEREILGGGPDVVE